MILTWQKLGFLLAIALLYTLHWTASSRETLLPGGDNYSRASLEMCGLEFSHCYSICWLLFQLTPCPLMSLLVLVLITGSFYYALFLAFGYFDCPRTRQRHAIQVTQISHKRRLNRTASSTAECSLMDTQLEGQTGTPQGALDPPPVQPKPPPRNRKRQAPTPPAPNPHPSPKNSFGSTSCLQGFTQEAHPDLYRSLRQNLQRALDGLQKPLPTPTPLPLPVPVALPLPPYPTQLNDSLSGYSVAQEKMKSRPKLLRGILNRLGVSSKKSQRDKGSSSSSSSILRPLWQRLRPRSRGKIEADTPHSTCSSSCSSRSDESRVMCPTERSQRTAWQSSYT